MNQTVRSTIWNVLRLSKQDSIIQMGMNPAQKRPQTDQTKNAFQID